MHRRWKPSPGCCGTRSKRQLVSDVPVCSFLSGGIDSSVVTAIASRELGAEGVTLNTFSFDFAHNDTCFQANAFQPTRDRPYVDQVLALYPLAPYLSGV